MRIVVFCFCLIICRVAAGQTCTTRGQTPATAFPVCGTKTFEQQTVPLCGNRVLPSPCKRDGVTDTNPFWYKFTCFKEGSLGFLITPNNIGDDYDWELYDITNHAPNEVFVDGNLSVACNWSGEKGKTGAVGTAGDIFVCAGLGKPLFSRQPVLKRNHNYLLLVSHFDPFTNSEEGYKLEFNGGTAVITDTTQPKIELVTSNCAGNIIGIKLNKKMLCKSIAEDGSDFFINGNPAAVISATGIGCSTKFDTDSIEVTLSRDLNPGNYSLQVKVGTDGNTILDICESALPVDQPMGFRVFEKTATPMDSLVKPTCAPQELKLVFSGSILCNSIASDGSDFAMTGPYPVGIVSATGNCTGLNTKEITIQLAEPISLKGDFKITLKNGTDGNTLLNECNIETATGSSIAFSVKDTVSAAFTYNKTYGCETDIVYFSHTGDHEVNSWNWNLDENKISTQQNPVADYSLFTNKIISLVVSNGFCNDSSSQLVELTNFIKADFTLAEDNCPLDPIKFYSTAIGNNLTHNWNFGDGSGSDTVSPPMYMRGWQQPGILSFDIQSLIVLVVPAVLKNQPASTSVASSIYQMLLPQIQMEKTIFCTP